jgi:hypothetical protein
MAEPDDSTPVVDVQERSQKNDDTEEMLGYLDELSDKDRANLLATLRDYNSKDRKMASNAAASPSRSVDYMSQLDTNQDEKVKTQLYKASKASEAQQKANLANAYGGKVPARQLQPNLLISLVPCSERGLGEAKVVLHKSDRGADPISSKKTRDKVIKSLEPKILAGNISRILTSVDASEYDIATDALSWQSSLKLIKKFCIQYDMLSLLKIPQGVDLAQPYQVAKAVLLKDAIDDWQDLDDTDYFNWQEFILRNGTNVELKSDNWLDNSLLMSLEKTLWAEVESDLCSLSLSRRGSLTNLCCIIKQIWGSCYCCIHAIGACNPSQELVLFAMPFLLLSHQIQDITCLQSSSTLYSSDLPHHASG